MKIQIVMAALALAATAVTAQEAPPPIEDNSFLIEEAYNQERGIVQHVSTFSRAKGSAGWVYEFAQEWPLAGQKHQVSYTVPLARNDDRLAPRTGVGDIALNYRYQIGGANAFALAPSLTLVLPTGDSRRALGAGGTGFEIKLPF